MDYENLLKDALDPDKAPVALSSLGEYIKNIETSINTLKETNTEQDKRIRNLQDTNMALFLKVGTTIQNEEPPKELTPEEVETNLINKIKGGNL